MKNQSSIPETLKYEGWEEVAVACVPFNATARAVEYIAEKDEDFKSRLLVALYESHPHRGGKL